MWRCVVEMSGGLWSETRTETPRPGCHTHSQISKAIVPYFKFFSSESIQFNHKYKMHQEMIHYGIIQIIFEPWEIQEKLWKDLSFCNHSCPWGLSAEGQPDWDVAPVPMPSVHDGSALLPAPASVAACRTGFQSAWRGWGQTGTGRPRADVKVLVEVRREDWRED